MSQQTHMHTHTCTHTCLQEAGITELLMAPGKLSEQLPGCSGTRNLSDNLSDLKAQVGRGFGGGRGKTWG